VSLSDLILKQGQFSSLEPADLEIIRALTPQFLNLSQYFSKQKKAKVS
jgi:hypothetical protein